MKAMERLELLIKSEVNNITEYENIASEKATLDIDLHLRYKGLLGQYKHMMTLVGELIEDINDKENRIQNNAAIIEQRYYELLKKNQELHNICCYDTLTGVYSRKFLMEAVDREVEHTQSTKEALTIVMVDVDNFKRINDNLGHQAGDEVLAGIAQTMSVNVRPNDIVGRYGGEEFLLILPGADKNAAHDVLERLRHDIENLDCHALGLSKVTASFGYVTYYGEPALAADELVYMADMALKNAKTNGKNQIRINDEHMVMAI